MTKFCKKKRDFSKKHRPVLDLKINHYYCSILSTYLKKTQNHRQLLAASYDSMAGLFAGKFSIRIQLEKDFSWTKVQLFAEGHKNLKESPHFI